MERLAFRKTVHNCLEQDQHLSSGDKLIANKIIDDYFEIYQNSTGNTPEGTFVDICNLSWQLQLFGFVMSQADTWESSHAHDLIAYGKRLQSLLDQGVSKKDLWL